VKRAAELLPRAFESDATPDVAPRVITLN
jgi:hypothetical protein